MDNRLLDMLVCPICKGPLEMLRHGAVQELACHADRLAFPIRDGIPVMLENEARAYDAAAEAEAQKAAELAAAVTSMKQAAESSSQAST
ncbi:Trm112 family protein [Paucibacter sp. Y2R2-4]|nr:Trm112 family protein [Paucibacter sp. Y2R2-4]MCV2348888.1 Trm112 family protein [Paucibacter sp. Y2R2-4]